MNNTNSIKQMSASKAAIEHHYDVSNEFYETWLDKSMTYTAAFYETHNYSEPLVSAQHAKIDFYASFLKQVGELQRVCDIGCGWGGALNRLVNVHDVQQAVGITLSTKQARWIEDNINNDKINVHIESWAEHQPSELYDGLISVEAFEAFARHDLSAEQKAKIYRHFFQCCYQWLKPGGYFALQTIAFGNSGPEDFDEFIAQDIFPESILPKISEIFTATDCLFEPILIRNDRSHYAKTLRCWLKNLKDNRDKALKLVGEETVIRYERYLRLCIFMFDQGTCDLLRIILRRIDSPKYY